jgi:hypothetical protein
LDSTVTTDSNPTTKSTVRTSTSTTSVSASASTINPILASAPVSIATCQADCDRLLEDIRKELVLEPKCNNNNSNDDDDSDDEADDDDSDDEQHQPIMSKQAQDIFWQRHECRVTPMPYALQQALQQSSVQSTAGHGLLFQPQPVQQQQQQQDPNSNNNGNDAGTGTGTGTGLRYYVATAPTPVTRKAASSGGSSSSAGDTDNATTCTANSSSSSSSSSSHRASAIMPPALVLRGQYDFVSESNSLDVWGDLLLNGGGHCGSGQVHGNTECMTLAGTSHYAMVEQEDLFGSVVQVFLQKHDPGPTTVVRPTMPRHTHHKQHNKKRLLRNHPRHHSGSSPARQVNR